METHNRWCSYLEKQKEQKSFCLEPIFMVGDVMRTWQEAREGITDGLPVVTSIDSVNYICTNKMIPIARQNEYEFPSNNHSLKTQVKEQKPADYCSVRDEFDLDGNLKQKPAEWSKEDERTLTHIQSHLKYLIEHRFEIKDYNTMEDKMILESEIEWLKNRFKSLRPQPRQEVTDEEIEEMVIKRSRSSGTTKSEIAFYRNGIKDAIKRFGVRPSWKPSKKQMKELKDASAVMKCDSDDAAFPLLKTLYEQLQKL